MEQNTGNHFIEKAAEILANNERALEALYTANFYKTEIFVLANSGTAEEAKDIYQEAFVAIWQNIKSGRYAPKEDSSLEAYLFQIAKYKWYDHLKAAKKMNLLPQEYKAFTETDYNEEENRYIEQVQQKLENLGEPCRQVLTLFYFLKQSMAKIATTFSWTESTAKNNKYRCLKRLRNMVVGKK